MVLTLQKKLGERHPLTLVQTVGKTNMKTRCKAPGQSGELTVEVLARSVLCSGDVQYSWNVLCIHQYLAWTFNLITLAKSC